MSFLAPALLAALPLAALPIVIHLIHLYRRRQVKWAAMIFLHAAQRMNKGLSRLRQILILALRALAIAALILMITRPLAGGWLGLTGGAPDTVLVLLDRSASMEQKNLATGVSKRLAGLQNLSKAITDTSGTRAHLVLIESARLQPLAIAKPALLTDLPQTEPTETAADLPALLQAALDEITKNKTGRTDVWLLSDLQATDWDAASGRWAGLRAAFATLKGVRFHLLCYPQIARDDLSLTIDRVVRREAGEKAELLLDLRITRHAENPPALELPLRIVVNGTAATAQITLKDQQFVQQAFSVPLEKSTKRGWGRIELPADANAANNVFYFVFDEPPVLRSAIVCEDQAESAVLGAALSAGSDPTRKYLATTFPLERAAEIPWSEIALIVWQAPIPAPASPLARLLETHLASGRSVLFLPPQTPDENAISGFHWGAWEETGTGKPATIDWWRNDADLLANTRDGAALPVSALEISRHCRIIGEGVPIARLGSQQVLLARAAGQRSGSVYFLGTLPGQGSSSLARDGVVFFAMVQRALHAGAGTLGKAQQGWAAAGALGSDLEKWHAIEEKNPASGWRANLPLRAGVFAAGDQTMALNRPPSEDLPQVLSTSAVNELFAGLDFRVLTDDLADRRSLTNEVWRTFLSLMAIALLGEALLCLPGRRTQLLKTSSAFSRDADSGEQQKSSFGPGTPMATASPDSAAK